MNYPIFSIRQSRLMLLVLASTFVLSPPAFAQSASGTARASNNGNGATLTVAPPAGVPKAQGLSLAGAKVFSTPKEDYSISAPTLLTRPPTATELAKMQGLIPFVQALSALGTTPAQKAAAEAAFAAAALAKLGPAPPDFALLNKKTQKLDSGQVKVSNNDGTNVEFASAQAKQDAATNQNKLDTTGTMINVLAGLGDKIKNPIAVGYAVNIDPSAVDWTSTSNRTVTLDLTGIQLGAVTSGPGTSAAYSENFIGAFRDNTDDIDLPQDGASRPVWAVLGVFDEGDLASIGILGLTYLGFSSLNDPGGLQISDNVGGMGLTAVTADLASRFVPLPTGDFAITGPFSLTMTVPGSAAMSVLYLDQVDGAAAVLVPTVSSLSLLALGLVVVVLFQRQRQVATR